MAEPFDASARPAASATIAMLGTALSAIVAGLILAAAVVPAVSSRHEGGPAASGDSRAPGPAGMRVSYPPGHYPVLTLAPGELRTVRSLLDIRRPLRFGDYVWDDEGVPPGRIWVRVDLARQTVSVFRGQDEIGTALILYGAEGKPTPAGLHTVLAKAERHRSTLYAADMPYMLRLTDDGVAIHGSQVRPSAATHGCIGVPIAFARLLFAQARRGDRVAILPARAASSQ